MKQPKDLKRLIAEHSVEPMKYTNLQLKKSKKSQAAYIEKKTTTRHIMVQLQKNKSQNKE